MIGNNDVVKKVLVVDDEMKITRLLRDYLQQAGFAVVTASDGPGALAVARSEQPDMIVLDLGLPGMDGLDVTRTLRSSSDVPIIIVTARSEESDRIVGLELGADDYLVKPFSPKELVARVRAVLRRVDASVETSELVRTGDLEIDTVKRRVSAYTSGRVCARKRNLRGEASSSSCSINLRCWSNYRYTESVALD